jgi:small-conductance mechanosensitive channel
MPGRGRERLGTAPAGRIIPMEPLTLLAVSFRAWTAAFVQRVPLFIASVLALALFVLFARLARRLAARALRHHDPTLVRMSATLVHALLVALGVLAALWIAVPTFKFTEIVASLGVTGLIVGFALKDIIENFVAGILILWRRPYRVGDQIQSGSHEGTVAEINFRSTVLKTYDGIKVYVPNGKAFTEPIENKTGYRERRTTITLGIDQHATIRTARDVVLRTLREVDEVLPDPPPEVLFDAVGEFTNDLKVRFWASPPTRIHELATRSRVTERLYEALLAAGIGFPYPTRTVIVAAEDGDATLRAAPAGGG